MFNLPAVAPYRLTRAPLAQALGQVRFPLQARLGTIEGIAAVQDSLSDRYPYLQAPAPGIELQLGGPGVPAAFSPGAEQFVFSSDDGHSVHVNPSGFTLSVGPGYNGYRDFNERFRELVSLLHDVVRVPRCDRIAVRYLTLAATPPGDDAKWTKWFRPELLGWIGGAYLDDGTQLLNSLNQVQLRSRPQDPFASFPADVAGVIRHGLVPGGSSVNGMPPVAVSSESYVLDFDFFCEHPQAWDQERLMRQFDALHDQMDRFFFWALTDTGAEDFGYEEAGE